ncbi:uncharacterized protein EV154DRAFT_529939 [Mucor mucedo]|uniref:uncharacterized protein n=1 Tax=Mucor mucedo TaxID=29922 RepID=UPI00221EF6CA|nr:uncharacterized protein EV154DRAFT_529939 [Mucor mucedo]KAI7870688.1 hypothetical protein EV154DRAFT_529939 [Mucor mucedo]
MIGLESRFFQLILDKVFNTTVVTTSLMVYSSRDKRLILSGVGLGFFINVMLHLLNLQVNTTFQLFNSLFIAVLSTSIGWNILKKKHDVTARLLLLLLPTCFMINQGLGVSHRNPQHTVVMTMISVVLCAGFGIAYYATLTHFSKRVQTACCSIVVYLTGAIAVSKLFGSVEQILHPPIQNLVFIIRGQSNDNLLRLLFGTSDWNGTGYSVYWFMISVYLIYQCKK